jgi:hypothetical protein
VLKIGIDSDHVHIAIEDTRQKPTEQRVKTEILRLFFLRKDGKPIDHLDGKLSFVAAADRWTRCILQTRPRPQTDCPGRRLPGRNVGPENQARFL